MIKFTTALVTLVLLSAAQLDAGAHKGQKYERKANLTGEETAPLGVYRGGYPSTYSLGPGDSIGFTTYDYGTNGSPCRNLINYGDGTFSLGRMGANILDPGTPDRGTWFSYSDDDAATWPAFAKVEAVRTGWGSIDQIPDAGGTEVVVSHDFGLATLEVNVDAAKGAGVWSPVTVGAATWPRHAVSPPFTFHIISSSNSANPPTDMFYHRSTDAGATFDIVDQLAFSTLPGISPDADAQDIATFGNTVAMVSAGLGGDVGLMTSTDNGDSWTEEVIYDVAGLGELPEGDEEFQPDGSITVIFDNAGDVHVAWGNFLAVGNVTNDPEWFYSIDAPIMYWSEATGVMEVALPTQDTSMVPLGGGRDGNYASSPDIAVDAGDNLIIVYSSMISEMDTAGNHYEHVFGLASADNGASWFAPLDLTPGSGFDASFPSVADQFDEDAHIIYNCDPLAGNSLQGDHAQINVAVMYLREPVVLTDVKVVDDGVPAEFALDQNYPNPFNPTTEIGYRIRESSLVTLKVYDLLGREVASLVDEQLPAGSYSTTWNATGVATGMYLYKLTAGDFIQTKKLMLMR